MRILFLSPFVPYPENSGSKMRAMSLLRSLKDHEVILLAFKDKKERIHDKELKKYCSELYVFQRPVITAIQRFINHFSFKPLLSIRFYTSEAQKKLKEILKDKEIKIVVTETLLMAEYIRSQKNIYNVLDEHNLEFVRASRRIKGCKSWAKKIYFYLIMMRLKKYELKTLTNFDRCLVCSKVDKKTLEKFFPDKNVNVIPNTVDTHYFSYIQKAPDSKKIIFTGTMWYEPNVDAVRYFSREILPLLKADFPDVEFDIVGDRPTEDILSLSAEKGVSITGYVDDIKPFLSKASVFVAPIRMGSGTRLKILGAMSMGIPVVATEVGCEGIEVTDGENILIAENPYQFRDKIMKLFKDRNLRNHISKEGRTLIEQKYSHEVVERELISLWEEIESEIRRDA